MSLLKDYLKTNVMFNEKLSVEDNLQKVIDVIYLIKDSENLCKEIGFYYSKDRSINYFTELAEFNKVEPIFELLMRFKDFHYQVNNGGLGQYFDNGYYDGVPGCFSKKDNSGDNHKKMIQLLENLEDDYASLNMLDLIKSVKYDYIPETIYDEEDEIIDEEGIYNTDYLNDLDTKYYNEVSEPFLNWISNKVKKELE